MPRLLLESACRCKRRRLRLARQLAQLLVQDLLGIDINVLVPEEQNSSL